MLLARCSKMPTRGFAGVLSCEWRDTLECLCMKYYGWHLFCMALSYLLAGIPRSLNCGGALDFCITLQTGSNPADLCLKLLHFFRGECLRSPLLQCSYIW